MSASKLPLTGLNKQVWSLDKHTKYAESHRVWKQHRFGLYNAHAKPKCKYFEIQIWNTYILYIYC